MAIINLKLENQLLTKTNEVILSSGDNEVDSCCFNFDENWNGYIKTAVFYQEKGREQYAVLDKEDTCIIPSGAMTKAGVMCIGVFGAKGKEVITSTVVKVEILQGAVDGGSLDLEPADDIFLSIIAKYQAVLNQYDEINFSYDEIQSLISRQNQILEGLNAFDVDNINQRMSEIENTIDSVNELGNEFRKNFRIDNITVAFEKGVFVYEDERINEKTLCDVYFDTECIDSAAATIVSVESFDGYIQFTSTFTCAEELTCSIYCMGV